MMLVPRRNSFDLFDFFNDDFMPKKEHSLMKTDIKEHKNNYTVLVELPGFKKENIDLDLNNGYLNISAKMEKDEKKEDEGKYLHRERFYGECSRSFYVGDEIEEKDINAEFKDGVLRVVIPKKEETKKLPESKRIEIK